MSCGTALAFLSSKGFSEALCVLPFRSRPPCPPSPPRGQEAKIAADVWRQEFMSMSLSSDKPSNTICPRCTQDVCGLDSDKVAHKNFTRLELQDRHCNNFCFLTAAQIWADSDKEWPRDPASCWLIQGPSRLSLISTLAKVVLDGSSPRWLPTQV